MGLDPETGRIAPPEGEAQLAVAAFAAPGYTLSAHPAYESGENAPMLKDYSKWFLPDAYIKG